MVNVTNQIVQRLFELGFESYNNTMRNAISYFVSQNLKEMLGSDTYSDEDIEIILHDKSLSIEPNNADKFTVSVKDGKLVAISDRLLFSISTYGDKVINDRIVDNIDYRSVASEDEFALMKYSDSNLEYDVRAKNIGAVKTGKQLYQLVQNSPKDEKNTSFLYKLQNVLANKDIMAVNSDLYGETSKNYDEIFNKLREKYSDILNEDKNKIR